MTPSQRLKEARLAAGLSAAEVARRMAEATEVSPRAMAVSLARWEAGDRAPSAESLSVWASAVGIDGDLQADAQKAIGEVVGRHIVDWCAAYGSDAVANVLGGIAHATRWAAGVDAPRSRKRRKASS